MLANFHKIREVDQLTLTKSVSLFHFTKRGIKICVFSSKQQTFTLFHIGERLFQHLNCFGK